MALSGQVFQHRLHQPGKNVGGEQHVDLLQAAPDVHPGDDEPAGVQTGLASCGVVRSGTEGQDGKHDQVLIGPRLPACLVPKAPNPGQDDEDHHGRARTRRHDDGPQRGDQYAQHEPVPGCMNGRQPVPHRHEWVTPRRQPQARRQHQAAQHSRGQRAFQELPARGANQHLRVPREPEKCQWQKQAVFG